MNLQSQQPLDEMALEQLEVDESHIGSPRILDQHQGELQEEENLSHSPLLRDKQPMMKNLLPKTVFFSCVYGLVALLLTKLTLATLINDTQQLELIPTSWNQRSIVDIVVVNGSCPEGYENIVKGLFLGTKQGCDCKDRLTLSDILYNMDSLSPDKCSTKDEKSGCRNIPKIDPLEIDRVHDARICAKRTGPNFFEMSYCSVKHNDDVKLCNSTIIQPLDREPPVSDIQIVSRESEMPVGYMALTFNSSHKLIFARQIGRSPFIDFKFEEEQPCIDPDEYASPIGASWHKLDQKYGCSVEIAGTTINHRYQKIFTVPTVELYSSFELLEKLKTLPDYDVTKFQYYQRSLYWSSWIPWDLECEKTSGHSRQTVVEHINEIKDIAVEQENIYDLIWYGYFLMAGLHYIIVVESPKPRVRKFWNKIRQALLFIFSVVEIAGLIRIVWKTQSLRSSIELFEGASCSDTLGNHTFHHIALSLKYNQYADILATSILLLTLVVEVGSFLIERSTIKYKIE